MSDTWTPDALKAYVDALVERLDLQAKELRATDRDDVKVAHADLTARLEGFPQQYATKEEMKAVGDTVSRLDRETVAREIYDVAHKALEDAVQHLARLKLDDSVFQTYVAEQRRRDEDAAIERRTVAATLDRRLSEHRGYVASWRTIAAVIGGATAFLSFVVLIANHVVF